MTWVKHGSYQTGAAVVGSIPVCILKAQITDLHCKSNELTVNSVANTTKYVTCIVINGFCLWHKTQHT